MTSIHEALGDADRRLANAVRKGVVEEVDYAKGLARVRMGENVTTWLPWVTPAQNARRRAWSPLQVGEQVVVSSPSGDLAQGVIGGSLSSAAAGHVGDRGDLFREEYSDGCVIAYDMAGSTWLLDVPPAGKITLRVGPSSIEISAAGIKLAGPRIDLN